MCGIVGVLGSHEVAPVILDALKRLEYRGYDSAGIATIHEGALERRRATGKLINLQDLLVREPLRGFAGIGHTRWATHGVPRVENAHPHRSGPVAVVHNGIIENFRELRDELIAAGVMFTSETDTETIVHLANKHLAEGMSPVAAAHATLGRLEGAFALAFLFEGEEDLLIAARRGSPLVIGHGEGEMYVGSDAIALAPLTDKLTYLEEGDWAAITRSTVQVFDASGGQVDRPVATIAVESATVDKSGHRHFMAKEMAEQPSIIQKALAAYTNEADETLNLPEGVQFNDIRRVVMVACGTAFYACQVAKYWFEQIARIPVEIDIASEFRYRDPVLERDDLLIVVSQSGETADTLAALRHVAGQVRRTLAVVNVPTSSIAREADVAMPILAGPEIGVASTKAFTAQLLSLLLLAAKAGLDRGKMNADDFNALMSEIRTVPGLMSQALDRAQDYARVAEKLAESDDILFLGRGAMFPMALEAALKLKEISYIHAEAYAAGELKHGPIALIDKTLPIIILAPKDVLFEKTISNMQEVMARHGQVTLLTDAEGAKLAGEVQNVIVMPKAPAIVAPLVYAIPAQMLAYNTALARGTDVDQPRNLAKSVTVE
ncbi:MULTISPECIES: glutamine--fructose-6-phosphate transaminase (isomerizing) [unclassified Aliiroseovarius]|uniref:glutamine--fructose-6-phosphate transaminase (isomerizing) n=1 Tax=unclassified Aliiroseovarius TaxID=2623558 RepID=UPI00156976AC|nr:MULTISPECIES: glutamine--fructose-6-phosphate transaminase (isomerizing) [unclassified Aliiroseovarius]NRP30891.1 Glutamine--fructose-6-phosphate aminotransferase [isomerizing] [Aliiroseovarius sp. xm-m-314]NRP80533.1 Glutamine--fructose-6-phosphate aminotransferase [isomerizing] [Aliiroseovarius sp. xm-v-209]